jgi:DNA-binding winged helix-turn-helix (wHTH) protein/tetratricopeptide (TPR) repeat protein
MDQPLSYQLGKFSLDQGTRELQFQGEPRVIADKVFDFLLMLCQAEGQLVTKDEMYERLWPQQIVTEASLSRLVSDTRAVLTKDDLDTDYIQTVRGKGFRLNPSLRLISQATKVSPATHHLFKWPAIALASIALIGFTLWLTLKPKQAPSFFQESATIVVLPVHVSTGDDQDNWVEYGVMSMLSKQLESYPPLSVIDTGSTLKNLSTIQFKHETPSAEKFARVCEPLGCDTLIVSELILENGSPVLQYRIYTEKLVSALYKFPNPNVLEASKLLIEHALTELTPRESERIELKDFYINDPSANQEFALGVSALYHSDYEVAQQYLSSVLQRHPDFYWARAFLAKTLYRTGDYSAALELIAEFEQDEVLEDKLALFLGIIKTDVDYFEGNFQASIDESLKLLPTARAMNDQENVGNILMNVGTSYKALGELSLAKQYLSDAAKHYQEHGFQLRAGTALYNLANVYYFEDGLSLEAQEHYRQASTIYRRFGAKSYLAYALGAQAIYKMQLQRYDEARQMLHEASELHRDTGFEQGVLRVQVMLAGLSAYEKDWATAESLALRAIEAAGEQFVYERLDATSTLTLIYLSTGNIDAIPPLLEIQEQAEWFDPRPPNAMQRASFAHLKGELANAVIEAERIKSKLGEQWTQEHQAYLDTFSHALESQSLDAIDYFEGQFITDDHFQ